MTSTPYAFSVLRYIHDPVSAEFINIGVALYSPDARFFSAICSPNYGRISQMFGPINGEHFRQISRYIQTEIEIIGDKLTSKNSLTDSGLDIQSLLAQVLPADDSSIQFSAPAGGLTSNPEQTLLDLFNRYVEKYTRRPQYPTRADEDVWRAFRKALEQRRITQYLKPKQIQAPNYEYEFKRAWKNGAWHLYEPVSFDLQESGSIREKANNWVGKVTNLIKSSERFKLFLLLGAPSDEKLRKAFSQAENILREMPGDKELVREDQADDFAEHLKTEIEQLKKQ